MPVVLLIVSVPSKILLHNSIYSLGLRICFGVEANRHLLLYPRKVTKGLSEVATELGSPVRDDRVG